ncbi:hypothetical protein MPTA5024_17525 [Microbispora sp. ATCC PTA-5024]|nr:hypothetical protein MPTA5024_17525 [Microbispora sp. ATCC PTA-5024]
MGFVVWELHGSSQTPSNLGGNATGDEPETNVLRTQRKVTSGPLTLTVRRILVTSDFTRVELSALNTGSESLSLPVYKNSQLSAEGGTTLEAEPGLSHWPVDVPPGVPISGVIVFSGRLPPNTKQASFSFIHVISLDVDSITVRNLAIKATPTG